MVAILVHIFLTETAVAVVVAVFVEFFSEKGDRHSCTALPYKNVDRHKRSPFLHSLKKHAELCSFSSISWYKLPPSSYSLILWSRTLSIYLNLSHFFFERRRRESPRRRVRQRRSPHGSDTTIGFRSRRPTPFFSLPWFQLRSKIDRLRKRSLKSPLNRNHFNNENSTPHHEQGHSYTGGHTQQLSTSQPPTATHPTTQEPHKWHTHKKGYNRRRGRSNNVRNA